MSQEIELKFQIDVTSIKLLFDFFQSKKLLEQHSLHLANTYYDSDDHILRHHRSSLRIRGTHELNKPAKYEITVKSSGKSLAGLHSRQEYNVNLPDDRLNLSVLPPYIFADDIDQTELSERLVAQFSTNFDRHIWLINYNQSTIEIALDQGTISAKGLTLAILEVELELKTGSQLDLLLLALELSRLKLHLYSQSKAVRGFRLLQGQHLAPISQLAEDNLSIPDILHYWQVNEEYSLQHNNLSFYLTTLGHVAKQLQAILPAAENEYSTKLNQIYDAWSNSLESIVDVKTFAFSKMNNQLKIYWLLMIN